MQKNLDNLIISLTSFPPRIGSVHLTIKSLLEQTVKVYKIILWLSAEEFPNKEKDLPESLSSLISDSFIIAWCENLRSYKKLIPAIKQYPGMIVITVDDDIVYDKKTVEMLYDCHVKYPHDIIAHRITRMYLNRRDELADFSREMYYTNRSEQVNYVDSIKQASFFNRLTGCEGVLYPPESLHSSVIDEKKCMTLAPSNDDLWFWLHGVLNGTKVRVPDIHFPATDTLPGTQEFGLTWMNNTGGALVIQLSNILNEYPELKEIFQKENEENLRIIDRITEEDETPLISVVCFADNSGLNLQQCLNAVVNQSIKVSMEIIICAGSSDVKETMDPFEHRRSIKIQSVFQSPMGHEKKGAFFQKHVLPKVKGKYVVFCDENDYWIDEDKLQKQYIFMGRNPDFSLCTSGYFEKSESASEEQLLKSGKASGFEYGSLEIRGASHYHFSTIFCRKSALEKYSKRYANFKFFGEIHLVYYLLRSGQGWYFSEIFSISHKSNSEKNNNVKKEYYLYRELFNRTKDTDFLKIYCLYLEIIIRKKLYKNRYEKVFLLLYYYCRDSESIIIAIKKLLNKLSRSK